MSTLQLDIIKQKDALSNNITLDSDGSSAIPNIRATTIKHSNSSSNNIELRNDGSSLIYELDSDTSINSTKVGYRNIKPVGAKSTSYTLGLNDVGKYVEIDSGGSITIPNNIFANGDAISLFNNSANDVTLTCNTTTTYLAGTDSNQSTLTLSTRGLATILFNSGTLCVVSGNIF